MHRSLPLLALLLSCATLTHAQPDAGTLRQQIEQERDAALPKKIAPQIAPAPQPMAPVAGITITVTAFQFAGNTLLSDEQLMPAVAKFLNRPLDFAELQKAAVAVANLYREAGWIVRAYLPAQDINDGAVTIQIVEAVFGGLHHEGPEPTRLKLPYVIDIFEAQQKAGEPLNAEALDRALLLTDDLPGVGATGSLREGAQPHETDLVLKLADEPLTIGEVVFDNTGSRSTGSGRLSANLNLNSPFSLGDLFTANAIHTQGSDYLRLSATLPVGPNGWRVGANASYLSYNLVAPEFVSLLSKGSSDSAGLEATYPLIRSRLNNLYFIANLDHKTFDNQAGGAVSSRYKATTTSLSLAGNMFDNLGGGGANSASLALIDGSLNLDGSPNQAADTATTQAAGHYTKLRYAASRQQVITNDLSLFAALSGQYASKNLDSSEKFYLGGASGVRAYPSSEGGGTEGSLVNLELRWRLPEGFVLTGFYDYGHVTVNLNNNYVGAAAINSYSLKGSGLSLAWQSLSGPSVQATYARRFGNNPNPTATGNDQDGSLVKDRWWLTGRLPF